MSKDKGNKNAPRIKTGMAPTKERHQHSGGVMAEAIELDHQSKVLMHRYRAVWNCPLDVYRDMEVITEPEYQSGLRFRQAYYRAVLSRRADYERLNSCPTDTSLTPSERILKDAYRIMPSYNMGTVIDICGHDRYAKNEKEVKALRNGLGQLARRWHMAATEITRPLGRKI